MSSRTKRLAENADSIKKSRSKKAKRETHSEEEVAPSDDSDAGIDDDELGAIDTSNIITGGRRTRGIRVDYTKVEGFPKGDEDEDEDEDEEEERPKKKGKTAPGHKRANTKVEPPRSKGKASTSKSSRRVVSDEEEDDDVKEGDEDDDDDEDDE